MIFPMIGNLILLRIILSFIILIYSPLPKHSPSQVVGQLYNTTRQYFYHALHL